MVNLKIDGKAVCVKEGETILQAAKEAGINIPTLCFLKDINEIGACRVCLVEIAGVSKLLAACNTEVSEGMEVYTNSPRVRNARKTNLQFILSQHSSHCPTCIRSGNCELQKLSEELNLIELPFEPKIPRFSWDKYFPLVRDDRKCIKCMRCVNVCEKMQTLGIWEVNGSGSHCRVGTKNGVSIRKLNCALCGQCITHCPTAALTARDDTEKVFAALDDEEKTVVFQIAPAVRSAWGEGIGLDKKLATEKRMASAARMLGADYVFDTSFTADLTILEEGNELIENIKNGKTKDFPMFTSCCPGWVRFVKTEFPELCDKLSTAKSPQQMFGAITKTYFAEKTGIDKDKIFCVSVMPCVSKKYEADVSAINPEDSKDVDAVITTREFDRMLKVARIDVAKLDECEFDSPLGEKTGAGVIFGSTGGVMEAACRSAYYILTGKNPDPDFLTAIRPTKDNSGVREGELKIGDVSVKVCAVSGLGNARELVEKIIKGEKHYDFVEVMACPGGCAGGGGQPICAGKELAFERSKILYSLDKEDTVRFSHENPEVQKLYADYLGKPLSEKAHQLLHTHQSDWEI